MEWFDYTQYKYYTYLETLRDIAINEYNANKKVLHFQNSGLAVGELYDVSTITDIDWFGYPLVTAEKFDESYIKYWPETAKFIKTIPGTINCCINCIGPNSTIPMHIDYAISKEVIGDKEAIGVIIGISMPSNDPNIVGFDVGGVVRGWNTGDLVGINGYLEHGGWNRSNDWRITLLIDLDKKYWETV
jgi:hypothetical protein